MTNTSSDSRLFSFYLAAMHDLGRSLELQRQSVHKSRPLRESLYRILGTFAIGRGALLIWEDDTREMTVAAAKGLRGGAKIQIELSRKQVAALAEGCRPFHPHLPPGGLEQVAENLRPELEQHKITWIVPLSTGAAFVGLLLLGDRISGQPLAQLEIEVLEEMAGLLALRIDDVRLRRRLAQQMRELRRVNRQMRQIYIDTVRALSTVIDGPETGDGPTHSVRVAALASEMGRRLRLSREACQRLHVAGLLHDIGKRIISREVLGKRAPLNDDERRQIERHPAAGCELISHLRFPWGDVATIIRHHHERLDGRGYPDRLTGAEISIEAKILMMAEAFDSMTSDQPWRPRLGLEKVAEQIGKNLGIQFEPAVVQALIETVEAGLTGDAQAADFVPHLEAAFDPALIRQMLGELRTQIAAPTYRDPARVVEMNGE